MSSRYAKEFHRLKQSLEKKTNGQAFIKDWDPDNVTNFVVEISPRGGPYKLGKFLFQIIVPELYPDVHPDVVCLTDIYHPNIDSEITDEHNICLNLFDEWNKSFGLEDCVHGLIFLLYNPNLSDPISSLFDGSDESQESFATKVQASLRGESFDGISFAKNPGFVTPEDSNENGAKSHTNEEEEDGAKSQSHEEENGAKSLPNEENSAKSQTNEIDDDKSHTHIEDGDKSQTNEEEISAKSQPNGEEFSAKSQPNGEEISAKSQTNGEETSAKSQPNEEENGVNSQTNEEENGAKSQPNEEENGAKSQTNEDKNVSQINENSEDVALLSTSIPIKREVENAVHLNHTRELEIDGEKDGNLDVSIEETEGPATEREEEKSLPTDLVRMIDLDDFERNSDNDDDDFLCGSPDLPYVCDDDDSVILSDSSDDPHCANFLPYEEPEYSWTKLELNEEVPYMEALGCRFVYSNQSDSSHDDDSSNSMIDSDMDSIEDDDEDGDVIELGNTRVIIRRVRRPGRRRQGLVLEEVETGVVWPALRRFMCQGLHAVRPFFHVVWPLVAFEEVGFLWTCSLWLFADAKPKMTRRVLR